MGCVCARRTDEYHGWECEITGGACLYLYPNQKACHDKFGEVDDPDNPEEDTEP